MSSVPANCHFVPTSSPSAPASAITSDVLPVPVASHAVVAAAGCNCECSTAAHWVMCLQHSSLALPHINESMKARHNVAIYDEASAAGRLTLQPCLWVRLHLGAHTAGSRACRGCRGVRTTPQTPGTGTQAAAHSKGRSIQPCVSTGEMRCTAVALV
jgi:hypothetical protein